jgi:hypothetical protein
MLKSIEETKKLFTIEGIKNGQVNIKTSKHLLSLPDEKQIEVLTTHLKNLKKDSEKYEPPAFEEPNGQSDDTDRMQLQILIQVIEGLLNQI